MSIYYSFKLFFRGHPKVKRVDMMHTSDYSNMKIEQVARKLDTVKKTDQAIAAAIE